MLRSVENEPAVQEQLGGVVATYAQDAENRCSVGRDVAVDADGFIISDAGYRFDLTYEPTLSADSVSTDVIRQGSTERCQAAVAIDDFNGRLFSWGYCSDGGFVIVDVPATDRPSRQTPERMLDLALALTRSL